MYFSGVHFNILDLFKVSVGKFSAWYIQPTFQTSHKAYSDRAGHDQLSDIPLSNSLKVYNAIPLGYEDYNVCQEQRHIKSLSMIHTYNYSGHINQSFQTKGIYVDQYV
jgi:hypothetical protein